MSTLSHRKYLVTVKVCLMFQIVLIIEMSISCGYMLAHLEGWSSILCASLANAMMGSVTICLIMNIWGLNRGYLPIADRCSMRKSVLITTAILALMCQVSIMLCWLNIQ